MDNKTELSLVMPQDGNSSAPAAIGPEQLKQLTATLREYDAGLQPTKQRIIESENWWKLRNTQEEQKKTNIGTDGGFTSVSGWLHNVLVSKHADAMAAYPEPNILPREVGDREEAQKLTAIVPCVLEQNHFEQTYNDCMWQKGKTGTGVYKVVWDASKLNGLGDISVEKANLLNLFWEPGISDIQKSRYFFSTELVDKDLLRQRYPQLKDKLKGPTFTVAKFQHDDTVKTDNKATVIECYYHKVVNGKTTLQHVRYVEDVVLSATENDPEMSVRGLYDHGRYPYEFDPLFPIEGSPCGYGYVDICRNPQTEIDLMKTAFVKNAMAGAMPRYFKRNGSGVNTEQFLDLNKPIVDVDGNVDELYLRPIDHKSLDGAYLSVMEQTIQELRETSGNTETSTGSASGVTAASAIAALQEASGKGSRDATQASYRSFGRIVELCIELIRQFYNLPRQFRILGQYGSERYISYTNQGIQPQYQGNDFDQDMGYRLPVFDIKVSAQKKNVYTKISQNELAVQFFQMGFFDPQQVDQTLMCLEMMDFDGKDEIMQKVAKHGTIFQKLQQYMQLSLMLAMKTAPEMVQGISQDIMQIMGGGGNMAMAVNPLPATGDNIQGIGANEPTRVKNARAQAANASQPG